MIRLYFGLKKQYANYYDSSGNRIASNYNDLLRWFQTQQDVTEVRDISYSPPCSIYKIFSVESNGYVPAYIMADSILPSNRIFGIELSLFSPDFTLLCGGILTPPCKTPVIGNIGVVAAICTTPAIGTISITPQQASYPVSGQGNWVVNSLISLGSINNGLVTLTFQVKNPNYHQQSGHTNISNEVVAIIDFHLFPAATVVLNNNNNPQIQSGSYVTVNTNGTVQFSGPSIVEDSTGATVEFANLTYLINN